MTDKLEVVSDPGEENCVISGKRKRNEINYRRNVYKKSKLKALERQFHWEVCSSPYDRRTMWILSWSPYGRKKMQKPRSTWRGGVARVMQERNLKEGDWQDRRLWRMAVGGNPIKGETPLEVKKSHLHHHHHHHQ
ncbi:hypothetical protein ANN_02717 [Periplaneta americana]|uniref:Uncharacterized protein n=1 Tax=Periplaneta americana TaxID=6978 RepID=A0ABQ8TX13_PERAM|nr:hypothetical protein ANN_02717 [Periplaneta americana]